MTSRARAATTQRIRCVSLVFAPRPVLNPRQLNVGSVGGGRQVLHDAVDAGARLCAIFKEPTITPSAAQKEKFGLKKTWGSPNGAMRRGWNGITISRDTIHIKGMELGFKRPVIFERQAVGGESQAGACVRACTAVRGVGMLTRLWQRHEHIEARFGHAGYKVVGKGRAATFFFPENGGVEVVDERVLKETNSAVVTYSNPLDNVVDLAHHFFTRCLEGGITPYVVTKKTVFKWQEVRVVFRRRPCRVHTGQIGANRPAPNDQAPRHRAIDVATCAGNKTGLLDTHERRFRRGVQGQVPQGGSAGAVRWRAAASHLGRSHHADSALDRWRFRHGSAQLRRRYAHRSDRTGALGRCSCAGVCGISFVALLRVVG